MAEQSTQHQREIAERSAEAILDATEERLRRGESTSIAAVARAAGVSRVTVYSHFPTREDLLEALVERAVRAATAAIDAADPESGAPAEALERLVAASWQELDRHSIVRSAADQLDSAAIRRTHMETMRRVRALIDRGRKEGAFRTDLPAEWIVTSFFALAHAAADEVRTGNIDADEAQRAFGATVLELAAGPR